MSGPTYDNRRARFAGGPKTASKKLSHIKRAAASRKVLSGYPRTTMFTDPQEVFDYLNADHIVCLRCGKPYKSLNQHLQVHGWTHDQYRAFYGLPWTKGLASAGTKKLQKANADRRIAEGTMLYQGITAEVRARAQQTPARKRAPYLNVLSIQHLPNWDEEAITSGLLKKWHSEDYYRILERMIAQDRALNDVCSDPDLPGTTATHDFGQKNSEFKKRLNEAWEALSFPVQAKAEKLGAKFRKVARKMRLDGYTQKKIAEKLGVHWVTVVKFNAGAPHPNSKYDQGK